MAAMRKIGLFALLVMALAVCASGQSFKIASAGQFPEGVPEKLRRHQQNAD